MNTAVAIDTLAATRELEQAGFKTEQAEAVTKLIAHQGAELATKADLETLEKSLRQETASIRQEVSGLRWMIGLHFAFTLAVLGVVAALTWQVSTIGQDVAGMVATLAAG